MSRELHFEFSNPKPLTFCDKVIGQEFTVSCFEAPFAIAPTKGKHDYKTCGKCKENIKILTKRFTDTFNGKTGKAPFPLCCPSHQKLLKVKGFHRDLFLSVPKITAEKIIFTVQHIENNVNADEWFKSITNYIDWAVDSFGQIPTGCGNPLFLGEYLIYVSDLVSKKDELPEDRKQAILTHIHSIQNPSKQNDTDLKLLIATYEKWFKIFPFELTTYFGNLKDKFEKQLPIFRGKPEINMYSGKALANPHTKESLIEYLISATDKLLSETNALTLYEKGLITDTNKIKLELIINDRRLKLKQGYTSNTPTDESKYRGILKEWFSDEKKFIDELTPLLIKKTDNDFDSTTVQPIANESKTDKIKAALFQYGFYTIPLVKALSVESQTKLIGLIAAKDLPYQIAMFDFLGYLKYLEQEHFDTKDKLYKGLATWLNAEKNVRSIKGNINVLSPKSKEVKAKFTAYLHKETVRKDYQNLK